VDFSWDFRGSITVTTTPVRILAQNADRIAYVVWNLGGVTVLVGFSQNLGEGNSIPIPPNGGSLQILWREDLALPASEVWACTPTGTTTLAVLEVFGIAGGGV